MMMEVRILVWNLRRFLYQALYFVHWFIC